MNEQWRAFLSNAGAQFDDAARAHFASKTDDARARFGGTVIVPLTHLSLISAEGPDTKTFLQGQLTNDVTEVTEHRAQLTAYCTPKGRIVAILWLFKLREQHYILSLPYVLRDVTLARLRKYVLMAKTTLAAADEAMVQIGLAGPGAPALVERVAGRFPAAVNQTVQTASLTIVRVTGAIPRFVLIGPAEAAIEAWTTLVNAATPAGGELWQWLDIQAGLPSVVPATVEEFIPQMLNLQALHALNFHKGCYTGQEIVARTHYLGRLKRRMYRARVSASTAPRPGDPLHVPGHEQSVGKVVAAEAGPDAVYDLLVVIPIDAAERPSLYLPDHADAAVNLSELPYPLETAPPADNP